ncbi:MAG TPA: hypothetical protein VMS43_15335 [Allosphingosinicella sp.]|nr:hypothetical protein [Allosphingosinicella sp.]
MAVAWIAISFDRRKTVNQELIRKRLEIYDDLAPRLNDLLCVFLCIGRFRSLPPEAVIAHKRELDRMIKVYGMLFSRELRARYDRFIKLAFVAFAGGAGRPALIAANVDRLKVEWGPGWQDAWASGFVAAASAPKPAEIRARYDALMRQFAREVGAPGA